MPGIKPQRADLPAGEYYDKMFKERVDDWRRSYTEVGMPVPGEGQTEVGGGHNERNGPTPKPVASPSPSAPPTVKAAASAADKGAGGQSGHSSEIFINEKGVPEVRRVGVEQSVADQAVTQDAAQKALAAKNVAAGGGEQMGKPKLEDFGGDVGAFAKATKEWRAKQAASGGGSTPLYPR